MSLSVTNRDFLTKCLNVIPKKKKGFFEGDTKEEKANKKATKRFEEYTAREKVVIESITQLGTLTGGKGLLVDQYSNEVKAAQRIFAGAENDDTEVAANKFKSAHITLEQTKTRVETSTKEVEAYNEAHT